MKRFLLFILFIMGAIGGYAQQELLGEWRTIDDKTGNQYAIVNIYKGTDGKYYGQILRFLDPKLAGKGYTCTECKGEDKGKLIEGLVIIRGMKYENGKLTGGAVLDPESGNFYHGIISFDSSTKKLKLRGSIDKLGLLGRSQYWVR